MEVVDIDLDNITLSDDVPSFSKKRSEPSFSSSFGAGVELLMNEKKKSSSASTKIDLEDLDNLENELNDLSQTTKTSFQSSDSSGGAGAKILSGLGGFGNMFGLGQGKTREQQDDRNNNIRLGQDTKETSSSTAKTWDGFSKVSGEIPMKEIKTSTNMTEREKRRKKRIMIKKMEDWAEKGLYKNGTSFNMDSNYEEVEDEYEGALEEKRKKDSIKLQGWWFTTAVNTLEYGNALMNPFDLNLDGWGEQVSEDLDSYDEIFSELHEKYKGGKMSPELSLLLRLGFSAAVVNMSNKMLSSATPGFNDVIKQSPELMKMFSNAAVETMSKQNSAFDFAKTMMHPPEEVNTTYGPPPAPQETKSSAPPPRPGNSMNFTKHPGNRPDLSAAQSPMFRESGIAVDSTENYNTANRPNNISMIRQEMKGPQTTPDLEHLLSGLKPKMSSEPRMSEPQPRMSEPRMSEPQPRTVSEEPRNTMPAGSDSIISLSSLKSLDGSQMPKKSRRRQNTSNKNTVSLDI